MGEKPTVHPAPYADEIEAVLVTGSLWNINNTLSVIAARIEFPQID